MTRTAVRQILPLALRGLFSAEPAASCGLPAVPPHEWWTAGIGSRDEFTVDLLKSSTRAYPHSVSTRPLPLSLPRPSTSLPDTLSPYSYPSLPSSFLRAFATDAAASADSATTSGTPEASTRASEASVSIPTVQELDSLFRASSKAAPLGVGPNPTVAVVPKSGFSGMLLQGLGYYGKESQLIRGARALYSQCQKRADDEEFLAALGLEKGFRASHALLVLHTWMILVRLRGETATENQKRDAAEVGQTVYDLFNHDCEKRVVAAGVTLLVSKWMKELEKNFYGACIAYDSALKPEAARDALELSLWRNVIQDGEVLADRNSAISGAASRALARYVKLQLTSLSLTGSDAFMTGNISFSPVNR